MKGFDYLSPQGFYDAVLAYGLPQSIIHLDRAAQSETQCRIRTFYGPTSPIVVSGVTKQGGPASPLKAIYTTSLGHRYLDDIAVQSPDSLLIATTNTLNADPHLPNDSYKVLVTMVEATDDSFIFAKSLHAAQTFCLHMERFQFAYGWLTQWRKTYAYVLGDRGPARPERLSFPSVSIDPGVDPWTVKHYDVPVIRTGLDFLNAKVDDPGVRFSELKDIVDAFPFPRLTGRLPVTLLRKMVAQNIISRCRALLSLQPIKQVDAEALDARISSTIHAILGMPLGSKILTLPVSLHGFGFSSLARINAGIVVDGIARDLNHHIAAYRAMARITLAEWTCNLHSSSCIYPLDGEGLRRSYTHYYKKIPAAWITAHGVMSGMEPPLSLRVTDHNDLLRGETSISHILALCNHHVPNRPNEPDGNTLRTLRGKGIRSLSDVGDWTTDTAGALMFIVNPERRPKGHWTAAQIANWKRTVDTFQLIDTRWLFSGPLDLMISRADRRHWAEERIRALVPICGLEPSLTSKEQQLWGSDGSMIPASASLGEHRTVTAAVTGPATLVVQLRDRNLSILHGELMGHVLGLVLCDDTANQHRMPHLYSDHQNSVDLLDDIRCGIAEDTRLRGMNGRSLYRWILQLMRERRARYPDLIPLAPIPSFTMDEFTFHRDPDGWIESNIRSFVDYFLASEMAQKMAIGDRMRMLTWVHNTHAPPDYLYTRAVSAHSAVIQLYARSGQLPLAETLMARSKLDSSTCRLCSNVIESMHHIFVDCRKFEGWRTEAGAEVATRTERKLAEMGIALWDQQPILRAAKSLFVDDPIIWPLKMSQYYLGQVPRTDDLITPALIPETIKRRKLSVHLASDWHTSSIRLAGRIFGSVQRTMAARMAGTTS
ncbi:hypothetical protein B0H13DRAFT_1733192 [Mycena leptocephala]|nr:hypothetical protein B0H13DRAFT_1733192 [Mycena leptocephala]